ncbi:MAG: isochorismatase family cysteine hydrolase [Bacillota bacterium]|nr:isochorismatase family cysteine hydrolase [Bacillota bacterium]
MKRIIKILIIIFSLTALLLSVSYLQIRNFKTPTHGTAISEYSSPGKALLVVDIQEDATGKTAKSPYPYQGSEEFIKKVNKIIEKAESKNILVIYIGQETNNNILDRHITAGRCIKGKPGAKLDSRLQIINGNYFSKSRSDAFSNSKLSDFLIKNQINQLYIIGLDATACVYKTALGAVNRKYKTAIIKDGVITFKIRKLDEILNGYKKDGISIISSTDF